MARIKYDYIAIEFDRDINDSISELEYTSLKKQGENFIDTYLKAKKNQLNPIQRLNHEYFSKPLGISYLISIIIVLLTTTFKTNFIFDILGGISAIWLIQLIIRYPLSYFKTLSEIGHLEISIRHYFRTHYALTKQSPTYDDYKKNLGSNSKE